MKTKKPSPSTGWEDRFDRRWEKSKEYRVTFKTRIKLFIRSEIEKAQEKSVRETIRKVRKEFDKCLYDKQWVELATPENFEAGKISITLFEKKLSSLNPEGEKNEKTNC